MESKSGFTNGEVDGYGEYRMGDNTWIAEEP